MAEKLGVVRDCSERVLVWASPEGLLLRVYRRLLILLPSFLLLGFLYVQTLTPEYRVEMTIAPPLEGSDQARSFGGFSLAGALGGVASPPSFLRFEDVYSSVRVSQGLIDKYHLDRRIFAGQWDRQKHAWRRPSGPAANIKSFLRRLVGATPWAPPDAMFLAKYLKTAVKVTKDKSFGTLNVLYSNRDRDLARDVLDLTYKETEAILIEDARARYANDVSYIEKRLATVSSTELRTALIGLLADSERRRMLVASTGTYAAEVIDGPNVPSYPSKYHLFIILAEFALIGPLAVFAIEFMAALKPFQRIKAFLLD